MNSIFNQKQQDIAHKISEGAIKKNWKDWKWQMRHAVTDIEDFQMLTGIKFEKEMKDKLDRTLAKFPLKITPYYLSLIDTKDYVNDPVFMQSFPSVRELDIMDYDLPDPLFEDKDSPVEGLTHRYPDRVLFHVSNVCSMYCRHCTRKRKVGDDEHIPGKENVKSGIEYIKQHHEIRDVLLSGGDPFLLSDDQLDWILGEIQAIPHVEVVRIGSRTPVVLPYRITDELVQILKKHKPLWINTHYNHPREMTESSKEAIWKLSEAGFPLGNQSVLLSGVNDCPRIMKKLSHELVKNHVRPYYIYQCDLSEGLSHFRTPISKGIEIMESLIGHTSGFSVPTYVIDAPGGGGKIPITPNYIVSWGTNKVVLRNYEGVICSYKEPDSYEQIFCDRKCASCKLQLDLEGREHRLNPIGVEKLMADYDDAIALTPDSTERYERRRT